VDIPIYFRYIKSSYEEARSTDKRYEAVILVIEEERDNQEEYNLE
jgi:hypothetical protein